MPSAEKLVASHERLAKIAKSGPAPEPIGTDVGFRNYFPEFKDDGEVIASFGDASLIRFLDGKTELRGGSKEDRTAAREWMSMFWHEAFVREP
jgi:hypothetical protein